MTRAKVADHHRARIVSGDDQRTQNALLQLTPRQREAWELHLAGADGPEIASRLGISGNRAYELVAAARRRLGLETEDATRIEEVLEAASPMIEEVRRLALDEGAPPEVVRAIVDRLNREGFGVATPLREASVPELLKLIGDRALKLIESVDINAIADAKLRDKMVAFGILVDKLQLLSGQPTQRMDVTDRRRMDELVVMMVQEARRRGIQFDSNGMPLPPNRALPSGADQ